MRVLAGDRIRWVEGWGMAVAAAGYVERPTTTAEVAEVLAAAADAGVSVVPRGGGCSYGDAALLPEGVVLDCSAMRRILAWDPDSGVVDVEPGVTVEQLWRRTLADGWWPPVVTGTMVPTIGGCLAMNVHGKNNWPRGPIGDHCLELDLMLPDGELVTASRDRDPELFHAVIGGFGQLGVITRARVGLKRVHSGLIHARAVAARDLGELLTRLDEAKDAWEYVVGWVDAFPGGARLGRGLLHFARHLGPDEDPDPTRTLDPGSQDLPTTILGVVPKSAMWRLMKPFTNRAGMRAVNLAKYLHGATIADGAEYRQSLAAFSFLLDYVPDWKKAYLPGGLIQHQSFVPTAAAEAVFARQLELCRRRGMPSFLGVLKRHRPDGFLLSHAVDGFSLALDFPVVAGRRTELWALIAELAEPVVEAGGRFYAAKDAALPGELFRATFPGGELDRFRALKHRCDPDRRLRSALADRLLEG
ncbi:MAG TPA: FAD-binding oxidoreductase [Candidatus Sulfomarinibacteraceae bacterium]|nr:FAD-binding oxidoreductase [Candidatus Sulfomarinibacteraceae bacterium]